MMTTQKMINPADLFASIADQLRNDRDHLNQLDQQGGNGNHGDNMVANFDMLSDALRNLGGQDASSQLRHAADLMQERGRGASAQIYAQGLRQASQQVVGRVGIGLEDLAPLLQGLLGGMQQRTDAQPGQGTMIDSLLPGIMSFMQARASGRSMAESAMDALGAAMRGSSQIQRQPSQFGQYRRDGSDAYQDPGASSGASFLQGLFRQFLG